MRTVLAAIDESPAARPVLETALRFGRLAGATIEAVHVAENGHGGELAASLADHFGVVLRTLHGPVAETLLAVLAEPDVVAGVFGARATPSGRRPAGHTALHILEHIGKPIVVVPPDTSGAATTPLHRLLVPLEGTDPSSQAVADALTDLIRDAVEVVVLHVFTSATTPAALDHAAWELSMWGDEFIARFCPEASRINLRTGPVGARVTEACHDEAADLLVLSWSQNLAPARSAVVRHALGFSSVPTLLLPIEQATQPS